jgi:hypothetical protein
LSQVFCVLGVRSFAALAKPLPVSAEDNILRFPQ